MSFDDPTFQMCGFGSNQEHQGRRRSPGDLLYPGRKVTRVLVMLYQVNPLCEQKITICFHHSKRLCCIQKRLTNARTLRVIENLVIFQNLSKLHINIFTCLKLGNILSHFHCKKI